MKKSIFILCLGLLIGQAYGGTCDVRKHPASLAATKELAQKMLPFMKAGKELPKDLMKDIPRCYTSGDRVPSCWASGACPVEAHGSWSVIPEDTTVLSVGYAFYLAGQEYFNGANGLLDYNKMLQFYKKHPNAKGDSYPYSCPDNIGVAEEKGYYGFCFRSLMEAFGSNAFVSDVATAYAISVFTNKIISKEEKDMWLKSAPVAQQLLKYGPSNTNYMMDKYYGLAKTKYKDVESFRQLKKRLFYDMIVYGNHEVLGDKEFWKFFAVSPKFFNAAELKEIKKMVRVRYNWALEHYSKEIASGIKEGADQVGYWEEMDEKVKKALLTTPVTFKSKR